MKKRGQFSKENFPSFPQLKIRKRGQFFILAAVILAGIIITLGLVTNKVQVNREPENFYDFSYEIGKESGEVLDYQIYACGPETFSCEDNENLEDFVDKVAADVRDTDPDANLIFIYGNQDGMLLKNYGSRAVNAGGEDVEGGGAPTVSTIRTCSGNSCSATETTQPVGTFEDIWIVDIDIEEGADSMDITIRDQEYTFSVSEHKQVIFIIQKDVEDETFIAVE